MKWFILSILAIGYYVGYSTHTCRHRQFNDEQIREFIMERQLQRAYIWYTKGDTATARQYIEYATPYLGDTYPFDWSGFDEPFIQYAEPILFQ